MSAFAMVSDQVGAIHRRIQANNGDFDRLNELLETVSINIEDDMEVTERIGFIDLTILVDSLVCRDLSIRDIGIYHSSFGDKIDVNVAINGIDAVCEVEYDYKYGLLEGTAKAEILTYGNAADTVIEFVTYDDFSVTSSVPRCVMNIEIDDVNFIDADFATSVMSVFVNPLSTLIEKELEKFACSSLQTQGVNFLNEDLFTMISESLTDFMTSESIGADDAASPDFDASNALNFQEIADTEIGNLFETALDQLDQLFGGNDEELGINNLLRSYILNENGVFVLRLDGLLKDASSFELHDKLSKTRISLEEVRVYGLDSLTKFDPLVVVGDYTLKNEFSWKSLSIEIDAVLDMQSSSLENAILKQNAGSSQEGIVEEITMQIGAENIDVVASLFALIDPEALERLTFGSVLSLTGSADDSWLISCLTSAIKYLRFSELSILPEQINVPTLEGFLDDGIDRIISKLAEIAVEMYHDFLVDDILPKMMQSTVKTFANDLLENILEDRTDPSEACPEFAITAGDNEYVDFREFFGAREIANGGFGDLFDSSVTSGNTGEYGMLPSLLWNLMDKELLQDDANTGMPRINSLIIDRLTKGQSGTEGSLLLVGDDDDAFNVVQRISVGGFDADIQLSASDVRVDNLNTIVSPLDLLVPVPTEPYHLDNILTIGLPERPMQLAGTFGFAMTDNVNGKEISNQVEISLDMYTASVLATMMLKIVKEKLLAFPLVDAFDLNCWIALIPAPPLNEQGISIAEGEPYAAIADFAANVAKLNLNVTCIECSSPGIVQLTELLTSSDEAQEDVTSIANTLLMEAGDLITGDLLQVSIDRLLNDASRRCRHSSNYDPSFPVISPEDDDYADFDPVQIENSTTYLVLVGIVSLALILLVTSLLFSIRWFTRRRHRRWLATLPTEQIEALKANQRSDESLESALNSSTSSMLHSADEIPLIIRYGMPILILGNIAFFISGHLNRGAIVNIVVNIAGETIRVDKFFEFSVAKSTIDIWNAGGKELAILILIFSGIWPYTKQLITLVLWFAPTSIVPVSRRGSILIWLDYMGKWSMVDIFVLIICLTAFRVSVNSPSNLAFLPEGFYSLDLLVVPLWGLYANLIAQLMSQISSHFIIHYHRKIAKRARDSYLMNCSDHSLKAKEDADKKVLLRTHRFGRPHRGEEEKLIVRSWLNTTLVTVVVACCAFIIVGCALPSFAIEVFGMLGVAVEVGQEMQDAELYHSVFTVIKLLFDEAKFLDAAKDYIGLGSFSIIFFFTVLIVPIAQVVVLMWHWFVPMTMKQRMKMSVLVEILQAWQYAEVYIIAIFVASWQLGPISSFMVNEYCGTLDGFFAELVFYGLLKTEDAQCFSIKSSIEKGFFILAVGAVLLSLMNAFVTKATTQYCRDYNRPMRVHQTEELGSTLEYADEGQEVMASPDSPIQPPPVLFTDSFRWLLQADSKLRKGSEEIEIQGSDTQDTEHIK